jgi:phosphoribosylglycinamide formyltransferase-1
MKLLLLASGSGTLAQAVIDAGFDICALVSDVPDAQVVQRAVAANIETKVIPYRIPRSEWDRELFDYVFSKSPDLIVSVGFMRILNSDFVSTFKVINSHPALLPAFPGAHAVRDALAAGVNITGCTVHWVDEGVDTGKIIAQAEVSVSPDDDESSLHERIKIVERELIVKTIKELGELS